MCKRVYEVGARLSGPFEGAFAAAFAPGIAAKLRARSEALRQLRAIAGKWPGTQEQEARRLGVTPSRFERLMRGEVGRLSLDKLAAGRARGHGHAGHVLGGVAGSERGRLQQLERCQPGRTLPL